MKKFILAAVMLSFIGTLASQLPSVSSGRIIRLENFKSAYVTSRHIDVWLPPGYKPSKKYPVLYMHDGQMLFDSTLTWNRQSWDVDDVAGRLIHDRMIRSVIIVGIWNGGESRHGDYFPQKPFESLTGREQELLYESKRPEGTGSFRGAIVNSDNYLKFLVKELKPYIDSAFPVKKSRKSTFIAGSSMGGLISVYAICEYPDVFAGAACLSTHWPGIFTMENNPAPAAFFAYLKKNLPDPSSHRIYFDFGTETLDAMYPPLQAEADLLMKDRGYSDKNWMTKEFRGEDHSEKAWKKRLDTPLIFLLGR